MLKQKFELCNSACPLCRVCGRHFLHYPPHRLAEYEIHAFMPKKGKCLSQVDLSEDQEDSEKP